MSIAIAVALWVAAVAVLLRWINRFEREHHALQADWDAHCAAFVDGLRHTPCDHADGLSFNHGEGE